MAGKFVYKWFRARLESERDVDFNAYGELLTDVYEKLDADGYDVVNVVPIIMGQSESCKNRGGAYLGDVGFSITRGAVVIGKKRDG